MQLIRLHYCKARVEPHSNEIYITHYIKYVFHGLVLRDCMTWSCFDEIFGGTTYTTVWFHYENR